MIILGDEILILSLKTYYSFLEIILYLSQKITFKDEILILSQKLLLETKF